MGLDTTHNAWHGPYSSFNDMRREIMKTYNGTDLFNYYGYQFRNGKPTTLLLENIEDIGLRLLFDHSDCDGDFKPDECKLVADSLTAIIEKFDKESYYYDRVIEFRDGCLLAYNNSETLEFH